MIGKFLKKKIIILKVSMIGVKKESLTYTDIYYWLVLDWLHLDYLIGKKKKSTESD